VTATLVMAVFLAAVCGVAAAGLYLAWPRRLTAEEWVLHRRTMSAPPLSRVRVSPSRRARPTPLDLAAHLERVEGLVSIVRADLALLRLGGQPVPAGEQELLRGLLIRTTVGGACGLALLGLVALSAGGLEVSPFSVLLPVASALLWPTWSWLSLRRRAGRLRAAVEYRLPRLLVAARVLLESGAATPEGALTHTITIYEDPAADLVREALLAREVRRLPLEAALDEVAQRYGVSTLAHLADSFRVGVRYGTRMGELLGEQSKQLREAWFADYRERITRAPILMTIPALLCFVAPLLFLIFFLVFTPLVGALGRL
jgi:Flp pilus assembly protein TadB